MAQIILASKSPRRLELLQMLGFDVKQCVSDFDESTVNITEPSLLVQELSLKKAQSVSQNYPDTEYIVAADTVVELNGNILGKPKDENDAYAMLSSLSGQSHSVHTGLTVIHDGKTVSITETTLVTMRKISEYEIREYIATGDPMDKAGAYGIQGYAGSFIEKIDGDYYTVVGLPICHLTEILKNDFGTSIFEIKRM